MPRGDNRQGGKELGRKNKRDFYIRRFEELADRAEKSGCFTYTGFHSPGTVSLAYEVTADRAIAVFGGSDECERAMVRFGDPDELGYTEDFPIKLLCIEPKQQKYADKLTHRDFLGAVLNLGLDRKMTGDIVVFENRAYVYVSDEIADYIVTNLERVKHTVVKCSIIDSLPEGAKTVLVDEEVSVASVRLDALVAKLFSLSRSNANELFVQGKVFVNGRMCMKLGYEPKQGEGISVRGHGKFVFKDVLGQSKKGKTRALVGVYR